MRCPLLRFKVLGHSMEPTIRSGQTVLVSWIPYLFSKPKLEDVIALWERDEKVLIKRISKIDKDEYFVKGDNKIDSLDSKDFGWIGRKKIVGKVICIFDI